MFNFVFETGDLEMLCFDGIRHAMTVLLQASKLAHLTNPCGRPSNIGNNSNLIKFGARDCFEGLCVAVFNHL
jgi:hypothetical protein